MKVLLALVTRVRSREDPRPRMVEQLGSSSYELVWREKLLSSRRAPPGQMNRDYGPPTCLRSYRSGPINLPTCSLRTRLGSLRPGNDFDLAGIDEFAAILYAITRVKIVKNSYSPEIKIRERLYPVKHCKWI